MSPFFLFFGIIKAVKGIFISQKKHKSNLDSRGLSD